MALSWLATNRAASRAAGRSATIEGPLARIAAASDVLEQQRRTCAGESLESSLEQREQFEQQIVGEGIGDFGPVGFEQAEVGQEGGLGDVERGRDAGQRVTVLAEFVGLEDPAASQG